MPRKTPLGGGRSDADVDASMRPRPDAAENEAAAILAAGDC